MANDTKNLREELNSLKLEIGQLQRIPCSDEDNKVFEKILDEEKPLPDGVYQYMYDDGELSTTKFYTVEKADLTDSEIQEYLTYKQLSMVNTIKKCVLFFTVFTVISIIVSAFALLSMFL